MKYKGLMYLGADLLNMIESSSLHSTPDRGRNLDSDFEKSATPGKSNSLPNSYSGNVLKNITNIELPTNHGNKCTTSNIHKTSWDENGFVPTFDRNNSYPYYYSAPSF